MTTLCLLDWVPPALGPVRFNGPEYTEADDRARLTGQICRVRSLMLDGAWRTVSEISEVTGDPQPSVSAQLRHLRKPRFGSYIVERRSRGDRKRGLFEYRLIVPSVEDFQSEPRKSDKQIIAELRAENARLREQLAQALGGA